MTEEQIKALQASIETAKNAAAEAAKETEAEKAMIAEAKALGIDTTDFEKKPAGSTVEKEVEEKKEVSKESGTTSITKEELNAAAIEAGKAAAAAIAEASKTTEETKDEVGGIWG